MGARRSCWLCSKRLGCLIVEGSQTQRCFHDGRMEACPQDDAAWALLEGMAAAAADMSFDHYLAQTNAPEGAKASARQYVEGFNAADAREIGIAGLARQQVAEDAIEGERIARVVSGYGALADFLCERTLAAGATLVLECAGYAGCVAAGRLCCSFWIGLGAGAISGPAVCLYASDRGAAVGIGRVFA